MIVADKSTSLVLTGTGDVLEPENGVAGIGSGGNYALAAARALIDTDMDAEAIARKAMAIAADICIYTNDNVTLEQLARMLSGRRDRFRPVTARLPHARAPGSATPHMRALVGRRQTRNSAESASMVEGRDSTRPFLSSLMDDEPIGYMQTGSSTITTRRGRIIP